MCLFMDNITLFKSMVFRAIKAQFLTPYDFAQMFCLDYSNVCKWYRDFKKNAYVTCFRYVRLFGSFCGCL